MMGFFDRDGDDEDKDEKREEVTLSVPEETTEESTDPQGKLKDEAEARLKGSSSDDSKEQDASGMLPGMGSDTGTSASPSKRNKNSSSGSSSRATDGKKKSIELEDIHRQNKQIKSILKDIRSEIKDEGDMNGVL